MDKLKDIWANPNYRRMAIILLAGIAGYVLLRKIIASASGTNGSGGAVASSGSGGSGSSGGSTPATATDPNALAQAAEKLREQAGSFDLGLQTQAAQVQEQLRQQADTFNLDTQTKASKAALQNQLDGLQQTYDFWYQPSTSVSAPSGSALLPIPTSTGPLQSTPLQSIATRIGINTTTNGNVVRGVVPRSRTTVARPQTKLVDI